ETVAFSTGLFSWSTTVPRIIRVFLAKTIVIEAIHPKTRRIKDRRESPQKLFQCLQRELVDFIIIVYLIDCLILNKRHKSMKNMIMPLEYIIANEMVYGLFILHILLV